MQAPTLDALLWPIEQSASNGVPVITESRAGTRPSAWFE